jgi:hypothetical protein
MIAEESYRVASFLDWLEINSRRVAARTRRALSRPGASARDAAHENARRAF